MYIEWVINIFVMYYIYGASGLSLLIESTDSMITCIEGGVEFDRGEHTISNKAPTDHTAPPTRQYHVYVCRGWGAEPLHFCEEVS